MYTNLSTGPYRKVPPSSYSNIPATYTYNATYGTQTPTYYPITLEEGFNTTTLVALMARARQRIKVG